MEDYLRTELDRRFTEALVEKDALYEEIFGASDNDREETEQGVGVNHLNHVPLEERPETDPLALNDLSLENFEDEKLVDCSTVPRSSTSSGFVEGRESFSSEGEEPLVHQDSSPFSSGESGCCNKRSVLESDQDVHESTLAAEGKDHDDKGGSEADAGMNAQDFEALARYYAELSPEAFESIMGGGTMEELEELCRRSPFPLAERVIFDLEKLTAPSQKRMSAADVAEPETKQLETIMEEEDQEQESEMPNPPPIGPEDPPMSSAAATCSAHVSCQTDPTDPKEYIEYFSWLLETVDHREMFDVFLKQKLRI